MTWREFIFFALFVLATLLIIWYILGGSGAPMSTIIRYSALTVVCHGGVFFAHKFSRLGPN